MPFKASLGYCLTSLETEAAIPDTLPPPSPPGADTDAYVTGTNWGAIPSYWPPETGTTGTYEMCAGASASWYCCPYAS